MNIPKEKLSMIGISIKVNRKARLKETKSGRWNQQNFSDGICSQNTLIKIERGQVSRFIEVYVEAAERLGLRLGYFPEVDKQIDRIAPKLYKAVEFYDIKKIVSLANKLIECIEPYSSCLWYCDIFSLITEIKEYYIYYADNKRIDIKKLSVYIDMIGEFDDLMTDLLINLIINSAYMALNSQEIDLKLFNRIYNELHVEQSEFICNKINVLLYCLLNEKTKAFLKQLDFLEDECMCLDNKIRLFDSYSIAISYLGVMGKNEVEDYTLKLAAELENAQLSDSKLKEYYYGLGTAYYEIKDYEKAIEYFTLSSHFDKEKAGTAFVYIASAQSKLNMDIKIPFYTDEQINSLPDDLRVIYKFFKMEEDIPPFIKQKYIMEEILPRLMPLDEFVIPIIKEQLVNLIQKTCHYKDSVIFDIKCREILKS